jgi:thioredoxin 1
MVRGGDGGSHFGRNASLNKSLRFGSEKEEKRMSKINKLAKDLQDKDFEAKVAQSKGLVLVDFWAEWCGPCKVVGPIVEDLAEAHQGSVQVYKLDVDENPESPTRFNIRGIPTVILFKDGVVVDQIVGSQPREVFERAIQNHVAHEKESI